MLCPICQAPTVNPHDGVHYLVCSKDATHDLRIKAGKHNKCPSCGHYENDPFRFCPACGAGPFDADPNDDPHPGPHNVPVDDGTCGS